MDGTPRRASTLIEYKAQRFDRLNEPSFLLYNTGSGKSERYTGRGYRYYSAPDPAAGTWDAKESSGTAREPVLAERDLLPLFTQIALKSKNWKLEGMDDIEVLEAEGCLTVKAEFVGGGLAYVRMLGRDKKDGGYVELAVDTAGRIMATLWIPEPPVY